MRTFKGVFNSDEVNRLGIRFPLAALVSALAQRWSTGTPNCIGHDRNRIIGWSRPLGVHLQPQLSRLTGVTLSAEDNNDLCHLARQANAYYADWVLEHVEPHVPEILRRLGSTVTDEPLRCDAGCAALVSPQLATHAAPQIFALRDKDGLVPLSRLHPFAPGVFAIGDGLLLFAHPYFRRSLSRLNTLNAPFLEEFAGVDPRLNPRIALDEDMVGLASTFQASIELQYWYGPLFNEDLSQIPSGITVHEGDEDARLYHGIIRTEFWWYGEGARRSFEAEEIVQHPTVAVSSDSYGCRFVHSMLSAESSEPIHLDGAIRLYDEERMLLRLDQDLYEAGRHSKYVKLWRLDGTLAVREWKSLIAQYFRDNWLVGEYFGAPQPEFRPEVIQPRNDPLQLVIPYNMESRDGVQIHVSYHYKNDTETSQRAIIATDVLTDVSQSELFFIDSTAFEVVKRIRREGAWIEVPAEMVRVAFGDTVLNLPLICHGGEQASDAAQRTLDIIGRFLSDMAMSYADRLISLCIAVEYSDREVRLSAAGHIEAVIRWLDNQPGNLPDSVDELPEWIEATYATLNRLFPEVANHRLLHQLLQPSGMLVFVRQFLDPGLFEIIQDPESGDLHIQTLVEASNTELVQLLQLGQVQVAPIYRVNHALCTVCGENYETCPHVKFEAAEVGQRMTDAPLIGAFWTNRRA